MATILSKKSCPTLTWQVLWLFVVLCLEMIQRYGTRPDVPGKCDRNGNSLQLRGGRGRMQDKYQLSQWLISFYNNILPKKSKTRKNLTHNSDGNRTDVLAACQYRKSQTLISSHLSEVYSAIKSSNDHNSKHLTPEYWELLNGSPHRFCVLFF